MASEQDRLAQIFIWREAVVPDIEYARQVLSAVNPDAVRAVAGSNPPLKLFAIFGPWPSDPWGRALLDMRAVPAPNGTQWTDTTRYDLAGWQGTDSRTRGGIFVVTAYRKANAPQTFQGAPAPAPPPAPPIPAVQQVPYYPQHPTGPINWPPQSHAAQPAQIHGSDRPFTTQPSEQSYTTITMPLATTEPGAEGYSPYYVGFPQRMFAGIIDLACMLLFQVGTLVLYIWLAGDVRPQDAGTWLQTYAGFLCVGLAIFAAYHVVQWTLWGQTLGKSLLGIKVVDRYGRKPPFGRALLRMTGYLPSFLLGGIGGFLLIAFDPRRQAFHDKIAETYVVPERIPIPVPAGLPGYANAQEESSPLVQRLAIVPSLAMTNDAAWRSYEVLQQTSQQTAAAATAPSEDKSTFREIASLDESLETVVNLPEPTDEAYAELQDTPTARPDLSTGPISEAVLQQAIRQRSERGSNMEQARQLFRKGIEHMEGGLHHTDRGYKVDPAPAREASAAFKIAADMVPTSVVYRYFFGVALRYAHSFEVAIREFRRVLELDPHYYEARQQVAYGQSWHDAFAYPPMFASPLNEPGMLVPEPILWLLPANDEPMTRLVVLREGYSKVVAVLSRTPRSSWVAPLTAELPARIDIVLSRSPSGPIIAFYVIVEDKPDDPYKGETFLNPHDPGGLTYDACQLGQNLLAQLSRQDHTYLIFVDEHNRLLLSRKLTFDPQTQVSINRCLYEVQSLPAQMMEPERFQQAAEWHMEHFDLDQIK